MPVQVMHMNEEIKVKWLEFSDGATTCRLITNPDVDHTDFTTRFPVTVTLLPTTKMKDAVWEIALVCDAIKQMANPDGRLSYFPIINLHIPYLPNGRADRVFEEGNPLPLFVFFRLLGEAYPFRSVTVNDPHSFDLLPDWVTVNKQSDIFWENMRHRLEKDKVFWLVAPDKGAREKCSEIYRNLLDRGYKALYIEADKVRDVTTGQIQSIDVPDFQLSGRVIIVDDICDGGGTFIPLANKLRERGAQRVDLYVTHGIFAKGLDLFKGIIDNIYCADVVGKYENHKSILDFNETLYNIS